MRYLHFRNASENHERIRRGYRACYFRSVTDFEPLEQTTQISGLGEATDLSRLDADTKGRCAICPALDIELSDKAASRRIPAFARPTTAANAL
jgi:hypothetical protein